jgi:hypothetical protein
MDIKANVKRFMEGEGKSRGRYPNERNASFDYCYNYFQSFRENGLRESMASKENLQISCLQLAFYLASWGMLRGSAFLLEKSARHYQPLVELFATFDAEIWEVDVEDYNDARSRRLLLRCKEEIATALGKSNKPSDILISKIMLGVFGNVPAFDENFKKGFKLSSLVEKSLSSIFTFYDGNRSVIDSISIPTLDFWTGQPTNRLYTRAKIIDMIGFTEGLS